MPARAWIARKLMRWLFYRPVQGALVGEPMSKLYVALDEITQRQSAIVRGKTHIVHAEGFPGDSEFVWAHGAGSGALVFFCHGGGYTWGHPRHFRDFAWRLTKHTNAKFFSLDYPLVPQAKAPEQLQVAYNAFEKISRQEGDREIFVIGDSAGAGLALALVLQLRDRGAKLPKGVCLISPWLDMTLSGESVEENRARDVSLDPDALRIAAGRYIGDLSPDDPQVSPLFGDMTGMPPMFVQVGSIEVLRDDSIRLEERVRKAGGQIRCDIWPNMHHDWHFLAAVIPEGKRAIKDIAHFMQHGITA